MKKPIKNIFSLLFFVMSFVGFSQEPSFYIRSLRSIHLENKPSTLQPISFQEVDVVYNKIAQFIDKKIKISALGSYEVSGFANINPGVMGTTLKDSLTIELYIIKNHQLPNETILASTQFTFRYGNLDVASGLHTELVTINLQANDEVSMWIKILPESTVKLNESPKYNHVNKPTGMQQIAGIRIAKI
ncbi:MAG TPA: hypothetical protein VLY87_00740 [Flavobacterium sp.]|nr:hypothetical protein [Flavobacterium sp.]